MGLTLVHLGDIHFKEENNYIINNSDMFSNYLINEIDQPKKVLFLITGDISFSGKEEEYEIAHKYFKNVEKKLIQKVASLEIVDFVFVPGNHDCNFNLSSGSRDKHVEGIKENKYNYLGEGDGSIINECCKVQKQFFEFTKYFENNYKILYNDKLLFISKFTFKEFNIIINCLNTSWISEKDEKSNLFFPIKKYNLSDYQENNSIRISCLHHPINWQNPKESDHSDLIKELEENSDLILTGHEHDLEIINKKDIKKSKNTYYFRNDIFQGQDRDKGKNNYTLINYDKGTEWNFKHIIFQDGFYKESQNETLNILPFREIKIREQFYNELNKLEFKLKHPNYRGEINLDDIFIYPHCDIYNENYEIIRKGKVKEILNKKNYLYIIGEEQIGKTALLDKYFVNKYEDGYYPLILKGRDLKHRKIEKLIKKSFKNQYIDDIGKYKSLKIGKKILLIDNLDKSKLSPQKIDQILSKMQDWFLKIVITVSNEYFYKKYSKKKHSMVLEDFYHIKLLPFGYEKRNELIKKWLKLGNDDIEIEKKKYINKIEKMEDKLNNILLEGTVPYYPIFILNILQTIGLKDTDIKLTSYGYCYNQLIKNAIKDEILPDKIDGIMNFLSHFAYHLYEKDTKKLSYKEMKNFFSTYENEYNLPINNNKLLKLLVDTKILSKKNNSYLFNYKYIYYFFVGRYFARNINKNNIEDKIIKMCDNLYNQENANILIFITHFTDNDFILNELIKNLKGLFDDYNVESLEKQNTVFFDDLFSKIPKLIIEEKKDVFKNRTKALKDKDKIENIKKKDNKSKEIKKDETFYNINKVIKIIEIIGQIFKNRHSSLKKNKIKKLFKASCNTGLQLLNFLLSQLKNDFDLLSNKISKIIKDKKEYNEKVKSEEDINNEKIKSHVENFLLLIGYIESYGILMNITLSLGHSELVDVFGEVLEKEEYPSYDIIKMLTIMYFDNYIPFKLLKDFKNKHQKNLFVMRIIKELVVRYEYLHSVNYQERQKIADILKIKVEDQRKIEAKSKINK
ncbi:MAG: hypothetical protein FXF47_08645 [Candidatus Mcinerneyibacterium aminivorans]|uniref:Calcineurin-like phosphoesterase domain-containing protein n=1 Tax=Candidatus Mcinerneyibacterium aminivorans TaxID=2703815 RepID=A0A5D0MG38_9BACT|nr:MAG: hypothetical protein FXF47_08645 [Candidatus Mcinerneyibacterium aminivorans]